MRISCLWSLPGSVVWLCSVVVRLQGLDWPMVKLLKPLVWLRLQLFLVLIILLVVFSCWIVRYPSFWGWNFCKKCSQELTLPKNRWQWCTKV